jgi:hypothetical protein
MCIAFLAEMNADGFGGRELEAALIRPAFELVEAVLKLPFDGMHGRRPVTDEIIINIQRVVGVLVSARDNAVDDYAEENDG